MGYTVSPNPARTKITITATGKKAPAVNNLYELHQRSAGASKISSEFRIDRIKIFDAQGKLLKQKLLSSPAGQAELDVHDLAAGSYYIEIYDGNTISYQPLIIVK